MKRPPLPTHFAAAPPMCLVAAVPIERLVRFKRWMNSEGQHVDIGRMCLDRIYAQERIEQAHRSGNDRLRLETVLLFRDYASGQPARPRAG